MIPAIEINENIEKQYDFSISDIKMHDLFMKLKDVIECYQPAFADEENKFFNKDFLYRVRTISIFDRFVDVFKEKGNYFEILFRIIRAMELFFDVNVEQNKVIDKDIGEDYAPHLLGYVSDKDFTVQKIVSVLQEYLAEEGVKEN